MTFDEWMAYGISNGFCGAPVCSTHDGTPLTTDEINGFEDGDDPCVHIVRMYATPEVKASVEENHPPSVWRDIYTSKA